jgi:hypothetical protein
MRTEHDLGGHRAAHLEYRLDQIEKRLGIKPWTQGDRPLFCAFLLFGDELTGA